MPIKLEEKQLKELDLIVSNYVLKLGLKFIKLIDLLLYHTYPLYFLGNNLT